MGIVVLDHNVGTAGAVDPHDETIALNASATRLFVAVYLQDALTPTVTWDQGGTNQSMTQISSKIDGANANRMFLFRLWNPTTGTKTLRVNYGGTPGSGENVFWLSDSGGDTVTGIRTIFTRNDGDGTGPGLTVTDSQNGDNVLHLATVLAGTITFDAGETSAEDDNVAGNGSSAGLSYKAAIGANTVVGCTDVATYAEIAVATIPSGAAAAAADCDRPTMRGYARGYARGLG